MTGTVDGENLAVLNALQPHFGGGSDAFVAKVNSNGELVYSTYLGGAEQDWGSKVAVDSAGSAFVCGTTKSSDFPTQNPIQATYHGSPVGNGGDAFVAKLNASGSTLVYSTYLGGTNYEWAGEIAIDAVGNAYMTGDTFFTDFPTYHALQPNNASVNASPGISELSDACVTKINAAGTGFVYST